MVLIIAACVVWNSHLFQTCVGANDYQPTGDSAQKGIGRFIGIYWWCLGIYIDANNGGITAFATIILTASTIGLWLSTDKLWRAGEETLKVSERAFVYVDDFAIELTTAADAKDPLQGLPAGTDPALYVTRFAVQPKWRNSGSTPVKAMFIRVDWGLMDNADVYVRFALYRQNETRFFLNPNSVAGSDFIEMPGLNALIQNGAAGTVGHVPRMLIWGQGRYQDSFGDWHWTRWAYSVRPERHTGERLRVHLIQYGAYNQSGDGHLPEDVRDTAKYLKEWRQFVENASDM